jgi:hypothetical protein
MKVFRELEIRGARSELQKAIKEIENRLDDGWIRKHELEKQMLPLSGEVYCFSHANTDERLVADLWLLYGDKSTKSSLYVSNIVPKNGELSIDQYNCVLEEFYEKLLKPVAESLGLEYQLTSDTEDIEDWVSKNWISLETAEKLKKFSRLANKYTGSSHPVDQRRWFDFLIVAHKKRESLEANTLAQWLVSEGWLDADADDLSVEYTFARSLLTAYDESQS